MTGMRKRSSQPKKGEEKIEINPLYNTSAILKGVIDRVSSVLGDPPKKKDEKKKKK